MDSKDFEGICKNRRATKRANAIKSSNLILMPWEKRHQHTMVRFLEKTSSQTSSLKGTPSQISVKIDQNYANPIFEQNSFTGNNIPKSSGKSSNKNTEEDVKKDRNHYLNSLLQDQSFDASVSDAGGIIAPSFKEKPLQLLNVQMSVVSKDTNQMKGVTVESKCDLSSYKTYKEQKHKLCSNRVSLSYSSRKIPGFTITSEQTAKYNLDELFGYQCPKSRRSLKEELEFTISPTQTNKSKQSNEENKMPFPRSFDDYLAKYNMEEMFKHDLRKTRKTVLQILGQLS